MTESSHVDGGGISDEVQVELKGPDPEIWGPDEERPDSLANQGSQGVAAGTVQDEGTAEEVKGPDPDIWGADEERPG